MLFGSTAVNISSVFGGSVPAVESTAVQRVIALCMDGDKMMSAVIPGSPVPDVNHFVVGLLMPGDDGIEPITTWPDLLAPADEHRVAADAAARRAGWRMLHTQAAGDCGIDCMSYHACRPRTPVVWRTIREELAEFMISVAEDLAWQDAFAACAEHDPVRPMPVLSTETGKLSSPSGDLPIVPSEQPVSGNWKWPLQPFIEGASNSAVVEIFKKYPSVPETKQTFCTWISSMPIEERRLLTSSYAVFESARQTWLLKVSLCEPQNEKRKFRLRPLQETKAAKLRHTQTLLSDRLQVGKAYSAWSDAFAKVGSPGVPAKPRNPHVVFLQSTYPHIFNPANPVQKKDKSWLMRAVKFAGKVAVE